jgi:hypothetical protein
MPTYRAYLINADNRVASYRTVDAQTDAEALEAARAFADGCDVEVWYLDRKVGRLAAANSRGSRHPPAPKQRETPSETSE